MPVLVVLAAAAALLAAFCGPTVGCCILLWLGVARWNTMQAVDAPSPKRPKLSEEVSTILATAKEAALLAGGAIRDAWPHKAQQVESTKSSQTDLVTETDKLCEELVIKLLRERFPDHSIIGEETTGSGRYELTDGPTWTVDPIDGTTNFVHRLPLSCVLISFLKEKRVLVAVTYDPAADELFYATGGGGTYLEKPVTTPDAPAQRLAASGATSLQRAVVSMDCGYGRDAESVARFTRHQGALLSQGVNNIRSLGSTGLHMAYVAAGRLDAGFELGSWSLNTGPKIWDFAAGLLLVQEAGGVTRDIGGEFSAVQQGQAKLGGPLDLLGRSFFAASSPVLADQVLDAVLGTEVVAK